MSGAIISVSLGPNGLQKNTIFVQAAATLRNRYPTACEVIEGPLGKMPHPLLGSAEIRRDPVAAHSARWKALERYLDRVASAVSGGRVAVVNEFGLDVHTPIMAIADPRQRAAIRRNHNAKVKECILGRGLPPPYYLLREPKFEFLVGDIRAGHAGLEQFPDAAISMFADEQLTAMQGYFKHIEGQHSPVYVKGDYIPQIVENIVDMIALIARLNNTNLAAD